MVVLNFRYQRRTEQYRRVQEKRKMINAAYITIHDFTRNVRIRDAVVSTQLSPIRQQQWPDLLGSALPPATTAATNNSNNSNSR
jgi:hypothetical protein